MAEDLPLSGRKVSMVGVAAFVPLLHVYFWAEESTQADYELNIDGTTLLTLAGSRFEIDPQTRDPLVLQLVGKLVQAARGLTDGRLEIEFEDGDSLQVEPVTEAVGNGGYEPWQLTGDDGFQAISLPGGSLVVSMQSPVVNGITR